MYQTGRERVGKKETEKVSIIERERERERERE